MANQINIVVGAEVNGALQGLQQVQQQSQKTFQGVSQTSGQATQSLVNLSRVAQDAPYGFIGIANNLNPLIESFQRLKQTTGTTGGAFKALGAALAGPAGLGLAVGVVSSLLVKFGDSLFGASESSKKLAEQAKKVAEEQKAIVDGLAQESAKIGTLVGQLNQENLSRTEKEALLKRLRQIAPAYFNDLKNEEGLVNNVNAAYDKYLKSLLRRTEAGILTKELEDLSAQIIELERKGAVRVSALPVGVGFNENRKITQENLKQLAIATQYDGLLRQRDQLLKQIISKSDVPVDAIVPDKAKVQKALNLVFQPLFDIAKGPNPILQALLPKDLNEYEKIRELISQNLQKALKGVDVLKDSPFDESIKNQRIALEEQLKVAQGVARGISDAFGQAFNSILEGENVFTALGNALKGFVLELVQATIKALIFRAIVNAIVPGGAQAVGATGIANLLGFRANGGPVSGRSPYIVGERGPELFVPSVSGNIVPNNQLGAFNGRPAFAAAMGGRSIVRGTDILLASARSQRSINRVNA